jgi:hypothetical protein
MAEAVKQHNLSEAIPSALVHRDALAWPLQSCHKLALSIEKVSFARWARDQDLA